MNQLLQIKMTSREIAELVESRHANVCRTIKRLVEKDVIRETPMEFSEKINNLGLPVKESEYIFSGEQGKRDSTIVVARLSPAFTARLVDRWRELEAQAQPAALPDFTDPAAAARAWADQHEKRAKLACEKAALEYQTQALNNLIEIDKPKVEFYEQVTGSSATVSMAAAAKVLNVPGYGRNRLFAFLRGRKVLDRHNAPYQRYIDLGWFRQVESKFQKPDGETCVNVKTVVFQRGVDGIRRLLEKKTAGAGEVPWMQ